MSKMNETSETGYLQSPVNIETNRFCLTLELKNDPHLVKEYEEWHQPENIWPEIPEGLKQVGIMDMEIYRSGTTLFMILTVPVNFDFEEQMGKLASLPRQAEWEDFMANYQQAIPGTSSAERWVKLKRVFKLP
jgi:L-rhamnose mutarotase